jgi:hypothetical protein
LSRVWGKTGSKWCKFLLGCGGQLVIKTITPPESYVTYPTRLNLKIKAVVPTCERGAYFIPPRRKIAYYQVFLIVKIAIDSTLPIGAGTPHLFIFSGDDKNLLFS